jgi:hypothetical protein
VMPIRCFRSQCCSAWSRRGTPACNAAKRPIHHYNECLDNGASSPRRPAEQGGPKPSRTDANPSPACGSRAKRVAEAARHPSARTHQRGPHLQRPGSEAAKGGRRPNFASKVKKAARWPSRISAPHRLPTCAGRDPGARAPSRPCDRAPKRSPCSADGPPDRPRGGPIVRPPSRMPGGGGQGRLEHLPLAHASRRVGASPCSSRAPIRCFRSQCCSAWSRRGTPACNAAKRPIQAQALPHARESAAGVRVSLNAGSIPYPWTPIAQSPRQRP